MPTNLFILKLSAFNSVFARLKLYTIIFLFCFLPATRILAQFKEIDSLKKILPSLHDKARINCLNELSKDYCNHNNAIPHYARTDSAEFCANAAYLEAEDLNYKLGVASAFLNLAEINIVRYNFVIAQNNAEKAIFLFKEMKTEPLLNKAYLTLADALWYESEITREQNTLQLALQYCKKEKDTSDESVVLDWLSECYIWKGDFEKGYEYLLNQINLKKNSSKPSDILDALSRKQDLYNQAGWYDSVASYSNKIVAYRKKMGIDTTGGDVKGYQYFIQRQWDSAQYFNRRNQDVIISNKGIDSIVKERMFLRNDIDMASLYQYQGKYEKAIPIFLKALQWEKEKSCVWWQLEALLNISQIYRLEGKDNDAIHYAQDLLLLAQKTQANYYMLNASKLLWEIYDKKKDSAIAYKYYLKYTEVKDSTINGTYQRKLAVINELTNEQEQQVQIAVLDKDNKIQEDAIHKNVLIKNILLTGVFILIVLGFIIYRVIDLKRENEKLEKIRLRNSLHMEHIENEKNQSVLQNKATELEMQALRAQMNPHFIFNCLNSINRFIIANEAKKPQTILPNLPNSFALFYSNQVNRLLLLKMNCIVYNCIWILKRFVLKYPFNMKLMQMKSIHLL